MTLEDIRDRFIIRTTEKIGLAHFPMKLNYVFVITNSFFTPIERYIIQRKQ